MKWIIEQEWKHVFFIHYEIDADLIKDLVPFKLDLYGGKAIISIVPFLMEGIRFPYLPAVPAVSKLWELNIRTYVEVDGVRGIYFFTLETDSKLGELIARKFFHLPYRYSRIKASVEKNQYNFSHSRGDLNFKLQASLRERKDPSAFDIWALERYCLFTKNKNQTFRGDVIHEPWNLKKVEITLIEDQFTRMVADGINQQVTASYSDYLKVRFRPFKRIS
jgi:uncharacterized protein YqjF (DUF2071 family)